VNESGDPVVVIGAGLVGLATAWQLQRLRPGLPVRVLEKEPAVGRHQSGHNSGVLHAGLYYRPGSYKARLAVEGIREMKRFCERHAVRHEECGKLVVAVSEDEVPVLRELQERGTANGLKGLALLGPAAMSEIEPHVHGVAALRVPEEGIVDFPAVCRRLSEAVVARGGDVVLNAGVRGFRRSGSGWIVETTAGEVRTPYVVACAGLHADRIARLAGQECRVRIIPFRGQYYTLRADRRHLVRHLIYPVPDRRFPFLGVHFTRRIDGSIEAGPNAVLALGREAYRPGRVSPADALETLAFMGLWRFVGRYPAVTLAELWRSVSTDAFARALARLVQDVTARDLEPGGAGVRAQAVNRDGTLVDDFAFAESAGMLSVVNAPSPAATASLAIGRHLAAGVLDRLFPTENHRTDRDHA
jgi:(S)-2-hydroxyglutarate dehydrogenase